uniref:Integrase catalytic domain-containing protein n=1 Tax=Fagus sylvatica TaxID=28930 RepID=A0A2N9HIN2_FAGSY
MNLFVKRLVYRPYKLRTSSMSWLLHHLLHPFSSPTLISLARIPVIQIGNPTNFVNIARSMAILLRLVIATIKALLLLLMLIDQTPTTAVAPAHSRSPITLTTDQLEDIITQALVRAGNASSSSALSVLPGTSQQNGRAKRKLRHILDTVRALLLSSKVPVPFWGEAVLTATHAINHIPSPTISNQTPYERLFGSPPHYQHLRSFGSAYFVFLQPYEHNKLEPCSRLCCFLGYGETQKGYRCYDPIAHRLRISRHVVFWEYRLFTETESSDHSSGSSSDMTPHSSLESPTPAPATTLRHSSRAAMTEELDALSRNRTWDLVDLPPEKSVECGIDYEETFAPVARLSSVRTLLAVAASLSRLGFSISSYDFTLFLHRTGKGTILLLLYVDDMIITGDDLIGIQELKNFLSQNFEMKDLGHLSYFLGLEITSSDDSFYLTQANLVYLAVTRPDISYAVHQVSQFMSAPRSTHYVVVLYILRYLKGTLFHGLHFSAQSPLTLRAYSDANWAGDPIKLNIVPLLIPHLNSSGCDGYYRI